jgi:hypothetical protein
MRPRVWHLALLAVLFASAAARSCAEFLRYGPYPAGEPYALLFVISAVLAGGPLVLASFRLWRRRQRDDWPTAALSVRIAGAAGALGLVGYLGFLAMILYAPVRFRVPVVGAALVVAAGSGFVVALGALELLVFSGVRHAHGRGRA